MFKKENIFFILGLLVPALVVFKALFSDSSAVWGDAPYFYPEALKELVSEPQAWTQRGTLLGGVNNLLWVSPLMVKYGVLSTVFGLSNDAIVRLIFYLPAIILAYFGAWLFARSLGFSSLVKFFTTLVYGFNTYFLLLIDGGQVGVTLAYGIFPLSLWSLHRFSTNASSNNLYIALISLFVLGIADPRFSVIALVAIVVWYLFEVVFKVTKLNKDTVRKFLLLCLAYLLVSYYWIYPTLKLGAVGAGSSNLALVSILNGLLLYQPHWPLNEFGKITPPPFYFVGIPILIFSNLFFKVKKVLIILLLFLVFVFFAQGITQPAGTLYRWILENVPFSQALRDSTKFFAPLLLFAGVLIGRAAGSLFDRLKRRPLVAFGSLVFLWGYLLFLLHPAFQGNLNGVLAPKYNSGELLGVKELVSKDANFSRAVWFPEKYPFAFQNNNHPALDAKELINLRPLGTLNTGTLDRFNFLNNPASTDWLKIFGLKYLVFSGEFRKTQNIEEKEDWDKLLKLVGSKKEFKKQGNLPVWQVEETLPHLYSVDKLIAVVGPDDVYEKLKEKVRDFDLAEQGFVFFEDGKLEPKNLQGVASESAVLLLNDKHEEDLVLSFLQKYFIGPSGASGDWAIRSAGDYLKWKYELLTQGVETKEFDYAKGVAFSSQPLEKVKFKTNIIPGGEYVLAIRSMSGDSGGMLKAQLNNENFEIYLDSLSKFNWFIKQDLQLASGPAEIVLENSRGFQVVNVVALIPKQEWDKAWETTRRFTQHFKVISTSQNNWSEEPNNFLTSRVHEVRQESTGTLKSKLTLPQDSWLILTDSWSPEWKLKIGKDDFLSLPIYSAVNGFYTARADKPVLAYEGQEYFRWGVWVSAISILTLAIYFFWNKSREKSN